MPNFGFDFEGLEKQFKQLENFEEIAVKILNECGPILERNVIKECGAHKRTADMVNSVKKTKVTKRQDGFGVVVRPTGKDRNGVRNMEKNGACRIWHIKTKSNTNFIKSNNRFTRRNHKQNARNL